MIVVSLVLVLVSGGLLAAGILSTSDPLVLASIALSLVAAVTLFLGIRQLRVTRPLMDEAETVHPSPMVGAEALGRAVRDQWRVAVGAQPAGTHDTATESTATAARIASPSQGLVRIRTTTGRPPASPTSPVPPTRASPVLPAVGSARVVPPADPTAVKEPPQVPSAAPGARTAAVEEQRDAVGLRVDTDAPSGLEGPADDAALPGGMTPDEGTAPEGARDRAASAGGATRPVDDITVGAVSAPAAPEPVGAVPVAATPPAGTGGDTAAVETTSSLPPTDQPVTGMTDTVRATDTVSAEPETGAAVPGGTTPTDAPPPDTAVLGTPADAAPAGPAEGSPTGDVDPDGAEGYAEGYDGNLDDDVPEPPDEPIPELLLASEEAKLARRDDEVLVVDGRPRYHLTSCPHLVGKDSQPLPVCEAMELGFTPCTLCAAATTLLGQVPA